MKEVIAWIDTEFSGVFSETDELLEVAALITDLKGSIIGEPYHSLVSVKGLSTVINNSSAKVQKMHNKSGLWEDLWCSKTLSTEDIDKEMVKWLEDTVDSNTKIYFGGNSITTDRNFLSVNLSGFYQRLSFRSIDATTLAIVFSANTNFQKFIKKPKHRALEDVYESIAEYRHYINCLTK